MAIRTRFWEIAPRDPIFDAPGSVRERLTEAGNMYLARTGEMPPRDDARADSAGSIAGGLKMIVHHDEAGRPHRTFELAPGQTKRNTWMAPYCADAFQMLRICQKPPTPQQAAAFEAEWRDAQRQIASGRITTLPEI